MAVPADPSDPLLKKWVKPQSNPFLLQVGGHNKSAAWVLTLCTAGRRLCGMQDCLCASW